MDGDIRLQINLCKSCAERKSGNAGLQPLPQHSTVGFPFEKVAIDITGPLPPAHNGHRYILGIIDYYSKYPVLVSIPNVDAKTVAEAVIRHWVAIFGAPFSIHSDRGTCFQSELFREMCAFLNIHKTKTAPYYPQADGVIERLFRTVKDMIYATVKSHRRDWYSTLPIIELGLRSSICSSTRFSPYQILFGKPMRLPLVWSEFEEENRSTKEGRTPGRYVLELQEKLAQIRDNVLKARRDRNFSPGCQRHASPLQIGDTVMAKPFPIEKGLLKPRYDGPYRIDGKLGLYTYQLTHCITGDKIERNHHHIKPCQQAIVQHATTQKRPPPQQHPTASLSTKRTVKPPNRLGFPPRGEVLY